MAVIFRKTRFWEANTKPFNRQRTILNRLFDDFEGKLTSSTWAKLAEGSQDTALRNIDDPVKCGVPASCPGHFYLLRLGSQFHFLDALR